MQKCIPIKKPLANYMSEHFPDFPLEGSRGAFYAFRRDNADGLYDHIIMQREFFDGTLSLVLTELASCYNRSWKGIPWFTVGIDTDIAVLMTGKNHYPANTGWHRIKNSAEELPKLFEEIGNDIVTYALDFFARSHNQINSDRRMTVMNTYMQAQLAALSTAETDEVKQYLVEVSQAYSQYGKMCKKTGAKETTAYYDILPLHPIVEQWITDIQKSLNYSHLSSNIRMQLIKDTTVLFRDRFDFYNLK